VGSTADLRVGVAGATVGFSGPRVIEAMTGVAVPRGTNTAESAADAGLLDAVVPHEGLATWLEHALVTLRPDDPRPTQPAVPVMVPERSGWQQVAHSRAVARPSGADLVADLIDSPIGLCGADDSVRAVIGRVAGHRVVLVALAARRAGRVTPAGFRLLERAAALADRLDLALVVLVDTAGADPLPLSEQAGIAPTIAAALRAVLHCAAPTVAVVHGEGGSGGALAGAVTDVVTVTEHGWFAALGPEGAAAALRVSPEAAADEMGVGPRDLLASGFADALAPADAATLHDWLGDRLDRLRGRPAADRQVRRLARWAAPLPGSPPSVPGPAPEIA
jgi:acyl-CoA carboxylase subunit beta